MWSRGALTRESSGGGISVKSKISLVIMASLATIFLAGAGASSAAEIAPFCLPGTQAGKCNGPHGVAADTETGHVYIADTGNNRINVFESDGTFISSFGSAGAGSGQFSSPRWVAVDNNAASASRHDVYVGTDNFRVQKFKPNGELISAFGKQGTGACKITRASAPVAVGPAGNVYVADSFDKDGAGSGNIFVNRVIVFSPAGACVEEVPLFEGEFQTIEDMAVDSGGHIYVKVEAAGHGIRKYSPSGVLEEELDTASKTGGEGLETQGLAVDSADNLFAMQEAERQFEGQTIYFFTEYAPSGEKLKRFGYVIRSGSFVVAALAANHTPDGDLYASEGAAGIKYLQLPPPGPVIAPLPCQVKPGALGNSQVTLRALINPEGKASSFKFEYLTQAQFEADGDFSNAQSTVGSLAGDFELQEATAKVENLQPETEYRCRVAAENADSVTPTIGEEGTFTTREGFEFGPAWSGDVSETAATIFAEGNPLEISATGQIEYVEDTKYLVNGFAEAQSAPTPELNFGNGKTMTLVETTLTGLKPGTLYHYRLRARNGTPPEGLICPEQKTVCHALEHTFTTFVPAAGEADSRRYELVSPGQKNSAEVGTFGPGSGFFEDRSIRIRAAAGSGEAVTYTSWTSFGQAEGAFAASQYLSKRTSGGWTTNNSTPFGYVANALNPPYVGFTPDLHYGAFKTTEPPLTSGCRKGSEDKYLRDNESGQLRCLTPEVPGGPEAACLVYAGSREAGNRVFVAGKPEGGENFTYSLYEITAGGAQLLSILPGGAPAPATEGTSFGPSSSANGQENCQVSRTRDSTAISADGSKVCWTYVPEGGGASQLLAHIDNSETVQLDKKPAEKKGPGPYGNGVFQVASIDGSVAYFTATGRLTSNSKAGPGQPDLYRYELANSTEPLTDVTKGSVPGDVQGVVGASADGSYLYFVAKGALTGEEANKAGEKAKEGGENLYLFHKDELSFIAGLSALDNGDWALNPRLLSSRVSADGKHLAFLSVEAQKLAAGYENTRAVGAHCEYVLNENSADPPCASCNPSGARPLGPVVLPGWSNGFEGPRFLSANGKRLLFTSFDSLVQADVSEKGDVYEFELAGEGSCSEANPNYDSVSGGCHFLVSSGKSSDESFLIDASADGRDVFFSTRDKLTGWDVNENFDIYDYREGGGFAEPVEAPICSGEASCVPPASAPPPSPAPATPGFNGPGNAKPKKHKAHKKKHKKQGKKKAKQTKKREAGR